MRFISGDTYQSVGDFANDVQWAYNNSEYLAGGTASYISETASDVKQKAVNFGNDVQWAYNNREIVAETVNEEVQQFNSDVKWAMNNKSIVAETTNEMATQAINDFNSKSLREKTAIVTNVTLNVGSLIGAPEAAATKLTQLTKVDKLTDAMNLIDKLYDAGTGMKRLDNALDTTKAIDNLYDAGMGMKKLDNALDSTKLTNWTEPAGSLGAMRNPRYAKYGAPGQRDALLNAVNNCQTLSEAKGVVHASREMKRLGYDMIDASLHYKANQGLDLVFTNGSKYAVVEAKHGRKLSLLKKDVRGLRQGSNAYNIDRLNKYLRYGDGTYNSLANTLIREARLNQLESFAALYRGGKTYELPIGWPKMKRAIRR